MKFEKGNHSINITQKDYHASESSDYLQAYSRVYDLEPKHQPSSIYAVACDDQSNCLILAGGGSTGVSKQSAILQNSNTWIGIGDQLVCLSLPNLQLLWNKQIDEATCFGVYLSPDGLGILVHGEISVSKVSFSGKTLWSSAGKDILTEGFQVYDKHIEVIDFNKEKYQIDIESGNINFV